MASLRLYFDLMSQPSRSVYIFMKLTDIPFTPKPVVLHRGEQNAQDFKKINPQSKVPVLDDGGFILTESVAILKYLTVKYNLADHWYPRDIKSQARVDEYLSWHHIGLRIPAATLFREKLIEPVAQGRPVDVQKVTRWQKMLKSSLESLEMTFLKTPFLAGEEISLADVMAICELTELYAVCEEEMFLRRPLVNSWVERVKERLQPQFDESHKIIFKVRETFLKMSKM